MKTARYRFLFLLLLLAVSCGEKKPVAEPSHPAVKAELTEVGGLQASFLVNTIDVSRLLYGYGTGQTPALDQTMETEGTGAVRITLVLKDLQPETDYRLRLQGIGPDGTEGSIVSVDFTTGAGPSGMYSWERNRDRAPSFADITLVTLGTHNPNPPAWTADRFASHVLYRDQDNKPHWLFDAFLCIDGWDAKRNLSYSITSNRYSAIKESWEDLLEAWLGTNGALLKLDKAIADAAAELGTPPSPRYVVMTLPDPVMFQYFADKSSSTTYWGAIDGKQLDFSRVEDQEEAYHWYMDAIRKRFHELSFRYVELAGFYILSEELPLAASYFKAAGESYNQADIWNSQYKRWEQLIPWVSAYAHSCNEGLWWIPYHLAPGYRVWKQLGFDCAFMQPNHYWDTANQHPMSKTVTALKRYKMGMEIEFEYSLVADVMKDGRWGPDGAGNMTFTQADIPALRGRLREYFEGFKESGGYGTLPIAVYSGTDAMHQLASSTDSGDREMYHELCHYIIDSPLKEQ